MTKEISITHKGVRILGVNDLESDYAPGLPSGSFANSIPYSTGEMEEFARIEAAWLADKPNRDRRNREYIAKLKESGEYGKEIPWERTTNFAFTEFGEMDAPKSEPFTNHAFFMPMSGEAKDLPKITPPKPVGYRYRDFLK